VRAIRFGSPVFFTLKEKFMNEMRIAVACVNASGMADLPIFVVTASPEEVSLGIHYDLAEALAGDAGYEGPFICYDADEYGPILEAARELDRLVAG
jgi:hypothetical protein